MAIFGPKPWVNLFGKMSIFRLFEPQVFIAQKGVFSFYNIVKVIFQAYIQYKKVRKTASFGPKRWVNPFGKSSIFRHLVVLAFFIAQAFLRSRFFVFVAYKGAFSFQIIVKVIFLTNIALKKRLEKWPYLDQNHGLTPLEKLSFFDILNFLFLKPRKAFYRSRIS